MAIALTALSANPTAIAPHGGVSTVSPTITGDVPQTVTITGVDGNGNSASVVLTINAENIVGSVNAADIVAGKAPAGKVVYTASPAGVVTLAASGQGCIVTAV